MNASLKKKIKKMNADALLDFGCHLINHHEHDTLSEEFVQRELIEFFKQKEQNKVSLETNELKLKKRIKKLEAQLKAATRILCYYGTMDIWKYAGVKVENKEFPDLPHTFYTSFESVPLKDGWKWAQEALQEIDRIRRTNGQNRKTAKNHK